MIPDSGIGKIRTVDDRINDLERRLAQIEYQVAIIFKHCEPTKNVVEVTARGKKKVRKDD